MTTGDNQMKNSRLTKQPKQQQTASVVSTTHQARNRCPYGTEGTTSRPNPRVLAKTGLEPLARRLGLSSYTVVAKAGTHGER